MSLLVAYTKGISARTGRGGEFTIPARRSSVSLVKANSPTKNAADLNSGKLVQAFALGDIFVRSARWRPQADGGILESVGNGVSCWRWPRGQHLSLVASTPGRVIEPAVAETPIQRGEGARRRSVRQRIALTLLYTGWSVTMDWVGQHPGFAVAFNHAMHDASIYTNAHKAQTVELLAKYTSIDPAVIL